MREVHFLCLGLLSVVIHRIGARASLLGTSATLVVTSALLVVTMFATRNKTLLVAKGIATRNKGIAAGSKDATNGAPGPTTRSKKLLSTSINNESFPGFLWTRNY